ncbi:MAG: hypothetical protein C7B45_02965 [Sulfobacillus acidophilus]|uniref:DUF58 domain-containing protein n=1 Tax=Sulfobacillus acidophilus TaxID=53633 RepID=A0A2T2WMP3_9FIRM|nr:MAG: hypothetical protein C7B45_02965 [Sulfobacillus acidophilus]
MIWKAWREETIPVLGLILSITGLVTNRPAILILGLFFWGLAILSSYLARRSLALIAVKMHVVEPQAEIGQSVQAEMIVENPLPWPILDMQWKVDLPQAVHPEGPGTTLVVPGGSRQTLTGTLWVRGRQRVRIQYHLTGETRGRWNIGPGSLIFRDPLSWNELIREDSSLYYFTVWPRRYPLPSGFWSRNPTSGSLHGRPWDPPDPIQVLAIRPYQPGDSVRHVAAHASARMARLMVKQLEPLVDRTIEVLLHPKTTDQHWHGVDRDLLEDSISLAASVVEVAVRSGLTTGLSSTGSIAGHVRGFTLPAQKRADAADLLTALAWTQPSGTMDEDLPLVLARLDRRLVRGATLVIVSPYWPAILTEYLSAKAQRGLEVIFLTLGDTTPAVPHWIRHVWHFQKGEWVRA